MGIVANPAGILEIPAGKMIFPAVFGVFRPKTGPYSARFRSKRVGSPIIQGWIAAGQTWEAGLRRGQAKKSDISWSHGRVASGASPPQLPHPSRRNASTTFSPPKAYEWLRAAGMGRGRATFGT